MPKLAPVKGTIDRGGTYHTNLKIPAVLRPAYPKKTHYRVSLKTSDPKVAAKGVQRAEIKLEDEANAARRKADIAGLIAGLRPDQKALLDRAGGLEGLLERYQRAEAARTLMEISDPVRDTYPNPDEEPDLSPEEIEDGRAAHRAKLANFEQEVKADAKTLLAMGQKVDVPGEVTGLAELASEHYRIEECPQQTRESIGYAVRRFMELHGDIGLSELTMDHLRTFDQEVRGLPAQWNAKPVRGLSFRDAVHKTRAKGLATISDDTRARHLGNLKTLLAWGVTKGFVAADPWQGYRMSKKRRKHSDNKKPRAPFPPEIAARILARAAEYDAHTIDRWAPLLACYQGARREEIGQLRGSDVVEIGGVWCIHITDEGEFQKIKTFASLRTIPLHPKVIEAGFLDFARPRSNAPTLFQEAARWSGKLHPMRPDARGRLTEGYGKRFSRLLREKLGITDETLVFHSWRHLWEDAAEDTQMPQTHRRELAGRSKADDSQAVYGLGPKMQALYASLARIDPLGAESRLSLDVAPSDGTAPDPRQTDFRLIYSESKESI